MVFHTGQKYIYLDSNNLMCAGIRLGLSWDLSKV